MFTYLFIIIVSLLYAGAQSTTAVVDPSDYRNFTAILSTATNSLSLSGYKVDLSADGLTPITGNLDLAGIKVVATGLGATNQQVAFGINVLSAAAAAVSWDPSSVMSGSFLYPIVGALAELVTGLDSIFLYQERNSVPGFQFSLGDPVFDCSLNNGYDCIILNSSIVLSKDLNWSPLNITRVACPPSTGYSSNCTIITVTTTGSLPSGTQVFQLTLRLADQRVLYGTSQTEIGPDFTKVDFTITYPWSEKAQNQSIANVGVIGYVGGLASLGIQTGTFLNKQAFLLTGLIGRETVLALDGSASLDSVVKSTVLTSVSGLSLSTYVCIPPSCPVAAVSLFTQWKLSITLGSVGGWLSNLFFLSWDGVGPITVSYDPLLGTTSSNSTNTTSPSVGPQPSTGGPQPSSPQPSPSGPQPSSPQPSPSVPQPQPSISGPQPSSPQPSTSGSQPSSPQPPTIISPQPSSPQPSTRGPQPTTPQPPSGPQPTTPQPPSGPQPTTPQPTKPPITAPSSGSFLAPTLFTVLLSILSYLCL